MSTRVLVIAGAGVNHNGSLKLARRLVEEAAAAGADIVKFQTFKADALTTAAAPKAAYQKRTTGDADSQREMLRWLELDEASHRSLHQHCEDHGIEFLSTAFDLESVSLLADRLGVRRMKIPSGEIVNGPLLLAVARTGLPTILSTGMSTLDEIEEALGVLAFGLLGEPGAPGRKTFAEAFASDAGRRALAEKVSILQCTTEYPTPPGDVNLRAMDTLAKRFGLPVGLSDHTAELHVAVAAVARGARILEKHFTLDRTLEGPDHAASLEPAGFAELVRQIRDVELALGSGEKKPAPSELPNRAIARGSLVAARPITAGELFNERNVTVKRPGTGRSPMDLWEILGRPAPRAFDVDEAIET